MPSYCVGKSKEMVTSRQNSTVKLVCSLSKKKAREETGLFRFDGIKLAREALTKGVAVTELVMSEKGYDTYFESLRELCLLRGVTPFIVADELFDKMSEEKSPEGVITVAKALDKLHKIATINNKGEFLDMPEMGESVMLLEAIRDPGNLGTVVRTAASLGLDRLVLSSDCADIYNQKTIRAAMGSLFIQRIDILPEGAMPEYIAALARTGRRVFGAALHREARVLGEFGLCRGDCFVIGNEGHGLTEATVEACESCVLIPMREGCESLNAAMAAGIFIWETSRVKD